MKTGFRRLTAFLLVVALLVPVLSACGRQAPSVNSLSVGSEIRGSGDILPELHKTDPERLQKSASSGALTLFFDPVTGSVSVYDASADLYWHALPVFDNKFSSVLSVTLLSENGRYYLNSQDHSVAFGSFRVVPLSNGVRVEYRLSDDAAVALKAPSDLTAGEAFALIPVEYVLTDGKLSVSVDLSGVFVSDGFILDRFDLLPYFGASYAATGEASDFLLVPDGPGALVKTGVQEGSRFDYTYSVSAGAALGSTVPASAGAFGIGKADAGLVALVDGGERLCSVHAQNSGANSDRVNLVYPSFSLSGAVYAGERCFYRDLPDETLSVRYRFLSAPVSSYMDMAAALREELVRIGSLPATNVRRGTYPLFLDVLLSADGRDTLTSYRQAEDLCAVLGGKGADDLILTLLGAFEGGAAQNNGADLGPAKRFGGKKDLAALTAKLEEMQIPLYYGLNLTYAKKGQSALCGADGAPLSVFCPYPGAPAFGSGAAKTVGDEQALSSQTLGVLEALSGAYSAGLRLTDLSPALFGDPSYLSALTRSLTSLRSAGNLMLSAFSRTLLPYADVLTDIPLETAVEESPEYAGVPFFPAVLHGAVVFSGAAVNSDGTFRLRLLKCVEYGAAPKALFVFREGTPYYYENSMSEIADFFVAAKKTLGDLAGETLESHEIIRDGVTCTGFSGGTLVYVNYNNVSVNINHITIPPYSYIRLG